MATVYIKFEDKTDATGAETGEVSINVKFDPSVCQDDKGTNAQYMALKCLQYMQELSEEEHAPKVSPKRGRRS